MRLTEMKVRNAAPREKLYRLTDGGAMYLLVMPTGSRYWRLDFALHGKRRTAALGVYPLVTLKEARIKRDDFKRMIARGDDPIGKHLGSTFGEIAAEWLAHKVAPIRSAVTTSRTKWQLDFVKKLNPREITSIKTPDVLGLLREIEATGKLETASRVRGTCSQVFRYGIATGRAERDICSDLAGALKTPTTTHRAAFFEHEQIGKLWSAISGHTGHLVTTAAMQLAILTFVRPQELRFAVWEEFDLAGALWRIPAARMKMKREHIVPLSRQSLATLERLQEYYSPVGLLLPSPISDQRPMGDMTVNMALRGLGFPKEQVTQHGFRRMASTILNEQGFLSDWIERQLAHVEGNRVRAAYNAAEYLEGRTQMMQRWADLLDEFAAA